VREAAPASAVVAPESPLAAELLRRKLAVLTIDQFSTSEPADQFSNFYCTYNRTQLQNRVRDLLAVCAAAKFIDPRQQLQFRVILAGSGVAGLWALMAAPGADGVVADCAGLNTWDEQALLAPEIFFPGMLAMGGFQTAGMLTAPHPLLLHNTGSRFPLEGMVQSYSAAKAVNQLGQSSGCLSDQEIVNWIAR
jgi:hypothetical protein